MSMQITTKVITAYSESTGNPVFHAALQVGQERRLFVSSLSLSSREKAQEHAERWRNESFYHGHVTAA